MGAKSVNRLYSIAQRLRRRCGQDPLHTLSGKDALLILAHGDVIPTHSYESDKPKKHAAKQARKGASNYVPLPTLRTILPERHLITNYIRAHPDVKQIPYDLNSFQTAHAKKFALRQHQLMVEKGMSMKAAFREANAEMGADRREQIRNKQQHYRPGTGYSLVSKIQEEEEMHLYKAYDAYRKLK